MELTHADPGGGGGVRSRFLSSVMALALTGCAGPDSSLPSLSPEDVAVEKRRQEIAQLRDYYAQLHRVDRVAFRIRTANRDDCGEAVAAQIGLLAVSPQSLPQRMRSFSSEALDLSWARPTVISVVEGSPAAEAGIAVGDELVAFNGELMPVARPRGWIADWLKTNGVAPIEVRFWRDRQFLTRTIRPVIGCAIPFQLEINPTPNAFTDFRRIVIHSGMLRLTPADADLAVVIGHELAHVTMGHYRKKMQNMLVGTAVGAVADGGLMLGSINTGGTFTRHLQRTGLMAFSLGFEREADYVGAYYAARAGYDIAGAENVWRALALESPASIRLGSTHPTTPERFIFMQKVAEEIADKRRRQIPLAPELKVSHASAGPGEVTFNNAD